MADTFPPKYELTTRPCTVHSGRYRWVITGNGKPVQTSLRSFETPANGPFGWGCHARKTHQVVDDWPTRTAFSTRAKKLSLGFSERPPRGGLSIWVGHFVNVRLWHLADIVLYAANVRYWRQSGHDQTFCAENFVGQCCDCSRDRVREVAGGELRLFAACRLHGARQVNSLPAQRERRVL
jgi:hypothetical protein